MRSYLLSGELCDKTETIAENTFLVDSDVLLYATHHRTKPSLAIPCTEGFNDWGGRGYDDFVPGEVTKTAPPGIGLHDPLHDRQACPEFIVFDQGVGQMCPR